MIGLAFLLTIARLGITVEDQMPKLVGGSEAVSVDVIGSVWGENDKRAGEA